MSLTTVDIVVPVLNEETALPTCVETLAKEFVESSDREWRIVIADNGSTDTTLQKAAELSKKFPMTRLVSLPQPGRGRALRKVWSESKADVCCYIDVDLSTDLEALAPLVEAVVEGGFDVATGSRLTRTSSVKGRSLLREFLSRSYNFLVRLLFPGIPISDFQCGFKAINRRTADQILPVVKNEAWFFDTELLIIADRNGLRITEIPVSWKDDPDSRVRVFNTIIEDLRGLTRLKLRGVPILPEE